MKKRYSEPYIYRPVDGSLLAHYLGSGSRKGQKGTTLVDLSSNGNDGTITYGAGNWLKTPLNHSVLDFDKANTKVDTGSDFIGVSAATISLWINPRSRGELDNAWIVNNGKLRLLMTAAAGGRVAFRSEALTSVTSTTDIGLNNWTHICVTRDATGADTNIYINGVLDINGDSGTPEGGTENIIIGNQDNQTRTFDGKIDDLMVYNRVFTHREIQAIYNQSKHRYGK